MFSEEILKKIKVEGSIFVSEKFIREHLDGLGIN